MTRPSIVFFVTFLLIVGVICEETQQEPLTPASAKLVKKDCGKFYSPICFKFDVVSLVDRLSRREKIGIFPGVSVIKEPDSKTVPTSKLLSDLAQDFPNDINKRVNAFLLHKIGSYLSSHAISVRLFDPTLYESTPSHNEETLQNLGETENKDEKSTARKKEKNGMGNLMASVMMIKGTLGALGFGALAMIAGKALMTGLIALMLSAIMGVKSMQGGGEKKTTYEILTKPVYTTSHSHSSEEHHAGNGYSGYARNMDLENAAANPEEGKKIYVHLHETTS